MIPKVKSWKVTFTLLDGTVLTTTVRTINKRFAKMSANEALGYPSIHSQKVAVSVLRS
jgi:hypothetical protein